MGLKLYQMSTGLLPRGTGRDSQQTHHRLVAQQTERQPAKLDVRVRFAARRPFASEALLDEHSALTRGNQDRYLAEAPSDGPVA